MAATDYLKALPDMVAPLDRDRPFTALGTDGFGRSDTREALRIHFEVSPEQIAYAALHGLCLTGEAGRDELSERWASWASIRSGRTLWSPDAAGRRPRSGLQPLGGSQPVPAARAVTIADLEQLAAG